MNITAIFELWTLGDGSYPHLAVGMDVNLSFEMSLFDLRAGDGSAYSANISCAEYSFAGAVIQRYEDPEPLVVVDTGTMRFFSDGTLIRALKKDDKIEGEGVLVVDYYAWAEYVDERHAPPDIFYNLCIRRIRQVKTPPNANTDRPSARRLRIAQSVGVLDVESTMTNQEQGVFFVLDLETVDRTIPRTFIT